MRVDSKRWEGCWWGMGRDAGGSGREAGKVHLKQSGQGRPPGGVFYQSHG